MAIRDYEGKVLDVGGGSDFGVSDYSAFTEPDGTESREATLTFKGRRLFPVNFRPQRKVAARKYGGGVMIALGDSYTSMGASYFSAFAEEHGLVCDNRGLASSTIAGSEDGITVGYQAFWVRLNEALAEYEAGYTIDGVTYYLEDIKLIVFMGGANDWSTVNDEVDRLGKGPHETDRETLYGALNYIFSTMLARFVNADIVVILQPYYPAATVPTTEEGATNVGFESLAQAQAMSNAQYSCYVMARKERIVREMAELYGLPICDCCFEWYNPVNPNDFTKYWQATGGHLNGTGNAAMITKLEQTVNNLPFGRSE